MSIYRWEPVTHQSPKSVAVCDVSGGRMLVKRLYKGARRFTAVFNGNDMLWLCGSLDDAKRRAEKHYEAHGMPARK